MIANPAPITLAQLFKFYRGLPHQMAAIVQIDEALNKRSATYDNVMRRDSEWFHTWSQDGKQLETPTKSQKPFLRLTRTGQRDGRGLEILRLERFKNSLPMAALQVVSGAPGAQSFRKGADSQAGSLEPLPEGLWRVGDIDWAGGPDNYSASWGPGLGAAVIPLDYVKPGSTERAAILFHLDANATWSPGTAGCVGFNNAADLKTFISWLRADNPRECYVDWGLGTCPKPPA